MSKRLTGKIAVITGGNSGIGLATAKLFHEEGATVVITARSQETFDRAKAEFGKKFEVVQTDVSKVPEIIRLADQVKTKFGKVDILFANAGIAQFGSLEQASEEAFDAQFSVNVKGVLFSVQKFAPLMPKGSSIVINTSVVGVKGMANTAIYSASKAAARSLARTLSGELLSKGIRVNAVAPGPIETPIYGKLGMAGDQLDGFSAYVKSINPMGRFGQPEEVARTVLLLASDESSYIAGAEIPVDGGFTQI